MSTYIIRRVLQGLVILLIISFVGYALTTTAGSPLSQYTNNPRISKEDRARIARELGVDQPFPVQYWGWLKKVVQGDFGFSFTTKEPVIKIIAQRLPKTLALMAMAQLVIISLSLVVGVLQAIKQYSWFDNLITGISFVGYSMPIFFIALSLILVFAVGAKNLSKQPGWEWVPFLPTGTAVWDEKKVSEWVRHMILPIASLTIIQVAGYTRYVRSAMLEVLSQDYVRTARAKGLLEKMVISRHALKNAALPFITIIGLDIPFLLGGAIVTEQVFSWAGMGRLFVEFAGKSDYPVIMGILMLVATAVVIFSILTDVVYTLFDPRIRLS
jgi:peptide/nickel transport system permease protein